MKKILPFLFLMFFATAIHAQSADVVTEIIETERVTFGQICYLSAVQQGFVSDDATYEEAIDVLFDKGQIPRKEYSDAKIPMANLAFIFSQMWEIKGGLFYRIFHGAPRYAFKQLKADGILPANSNPTRIPTGKEALNIYTSCCLKYGAMELSVE